MSKKLVVSVIYHANWIDSRLKKDIQRVALDKRFQDIEFVLSMDGEESDKAIRLENVTNLWLDKNYGAPTLPRYNVINYAKENNIPYIYMIDRDDVYPEFDDNLTYMLEDIDNYNGVDQIFGKNCWSNLPIVVFTCFRTEWIWNIFDKHIKQYPRLRLYEDFFYDLEDGKTDNVYLDSRLDFEALTYHSKTNGDMAKIHATGMDYVYNRYNSDCFKDYKIHIDNIRYVVNECNPHNKKDSCTKYILQEILRRNEEKGNEYISGYDLWLYYRYFYEPYSGRPWWDLPQYKDYEYLPENEL